MIVGWHYLPANVDPAPALPASTFLDLDPTQGNRSAERLCRIYFKGRPEPREIAGKAATWLEQGCRVQLGNEPNLASENFGGGPAEYAAWFLDVANLLPAGARLYYAGMSPGVPGWRDWYTHPLARSAIARAAGIAAHAYGTQAQMLEVVRFLAETFPGKPLWLAEVNFGAGQHVDRDAWAIEEFDPFLDACAGIPEVEAVTYFAYRWRDPDVSLPTPVDGALTAIEMVLGTWKPPKETSMPLKPGTIVDLRGKLPTLTGHWPQLQYHDRPLAGVVGGTLHYTAGAPGQTVQQIAAYQTSPAAAAQTGAVPPQPFPAIAYPLVVTEDGAVNRCHDLGKRTWHSGAVVKGVARNASHVGICYTGNKRPNAAQIVGIAVAVDLCEEELGRRLAIEGHGDEMPTSCPGPEWPGWWPEVEAALTKLRGGTVPETANQLRDRVYALAEQIQATGTGWQTAGHPQMAEYVRTAGEAIKKTVVIGKGEK